MNHAEIAVEQFDGFVGQLLDRLAHEGQQDRVAAQLRRAQHGFGGARRGSAAQPLQTRLLQGGEGKIDRAGLGPALGLEVQLVVAHRVIPSGTGAQGIVRPGMLRQLLASLLAPLVSGGLLGPNGMHQYRPGSQGREPSPSWRGEQFAETLDEMIPCWPLRGLGRC